MSRPFAIITGDTIQRPDGTHQGRVLAHCNALDQATWPKVLPSTQHAAMIVVRTGFTLQTDEMQPLWLAGPRAQWGSFAQHMQGLCEQAGHTPVVWPRLGDIVSDAPSLLTFIRSAPAWRFVVEPLALLTPEMLRHAPEHLERLADFLFGHHACVGIIIQRAGFKAPPTLLPTLAKVLAPFPNTPIWLPAADQPILPDF